MSVYLLQEKPQNQTGQLAWCAQRQMAKGLTCPAIEGVHLRAHTCAQAQAAYVHTRAHTHTVTNRGTFKGQLVTPAPAPPQHWLRTQVGMQPQQTVSTLHLFEEISFLPRQRWQGQAQRGKAHLFSFHQGLIY